MATSEKKKAYDRQYNDSHVRQIKFSFSLQYDADILAQLDAVPNKQGYIKELIRADIARKGPAQKKEEKTMMKIQFEAGTSRHSNESVNYLICLDDDRLYAETAVPDGASDDYGYMALKAEILREAAEIGINPDTLEFWYDGQDDNLEPDAKADCTVSR